MTTPSNAGENPDSPTHILVVDDSEDNLLTTHSLLLRPGVGVLTANCAAAALQLLAQHEVALALVDVHMPGLDGFELAERMRSDDRTRRIPIIFMSGNAHALTRTFHGYELGAVDFLAKPVDPRMLEGKVRVFVELHRQRQELRERNAELERLLLVNQTLARDLRKAHGKAVQEANTDALTGVSNRRHITELGDATLSDRRRESQPLCLAVLDLDHFKAVNDTYGHHIGDDVLRAFCTHVNDQIRPAHMLGRLGGEEFLLLMPGTTLTEAEIVLERVHRTLGAQAGIRTTFSAGVAQAVRGELLAAVIERADNALYEAKRTGRNCSVISPTPIL